MKRTQFEVVKWVKKQPKQTSDTAKKNEQNRCRNFLHKFKPSTTSKQNKHA